MRKFLLGIVATCAVALCAPDARAQSATVTVNLNVPQLLFIELDASSVSFVATSADIENEYVEGQSSEVTTRSNRPYELTVGADQPTWTWTNGNAGDTDPLKPASDLEWKLASAASFTPLSTSAASVTGGLLPRGQSVSNVDYRVALSYDEDVEGDYSIPITYTIVPN